MCFRETPNTQHSLSKYQIQAITQIVREKEGWSFQEFFTLLYKCSSGFYTEI